MPERRARQAKGARRAARATLLIAIGLLAVPARSLGADTIFWTNFSGDQVSHANLDGSGVGGNLVTTGATAPKFPAGVAIDPAGGRIYWANAGSGKVSYANLDGSGGGGDLNTSGATVSNLRGLAIDVARGRIYWASTAGNAISYANLDGSGGGDLSTTGATVANPNGIAIDPSANRIYWANRNTTTGNKISYAKLNGSGGGGDLITTGATVSGPTGVAVDPGGGRIYWTNAVIGTDSQKLSYASLDGSGGADLNTSGSCTTCQPPAGVALDPAANKIYWNNTFTAAISFANLDGTGSGGDLNTSGATVSEPAFVAALRAPAPSGPPAVSGASVAGSVLSCSKGSWAPDLVGAFLYRAPSMFAYQWSRDGSDIPGATAKTHTASSPGAYRCRATASNAAGSGGAQESAPVSVSKAPNPTPPNPKLPNPPPVPPSNGFTLGGVKKNKDKGTAKLTVEVPSPGGVELRGPKVKPAMARAEDAGVVELAVKAAGKARKKLKTRGKAKVNAEVTFTPDGGAPRTQSKPLKLVRKR